MPKDRPVLPYPTIFGSWVWDDQNNPMRPGDARGTLHQGEQLLAERPFNKGVERPFSPDAQNVCGSAAQWGGDLLLERDGQGELDLQGFPVCCKRPRPTHAEGGIEVGFQAQAEGGIEVGGEMDVPTLFTGGIEVGGTSESSFISDCPKCSNPIPEKLWVRVHNVTGCDCLDGLEFQITHNSDPPLSYQCTWNAVFNHVCDGNNRVIVFWLDLAQPFGNPSIDFLCGVGPFRASYDRGFVPANENPCVSPFFWETDPFDFGPQSGTTFCCDGQVRVVIAENQDDLT